jgi:hypothetical protein
VNQPSHVAPLDEQFPRRYRAEFRGRLHVPDHVLYIPARPALVIAVTPDDGRAWAAAFGEYAPTGLSGIFSTPGAETVCVVSGGAGYFVGVDDAVREWSAVDCDPVRYVLPFPNHGRLVFGSFTDVVAYRADPDLQVDVAWRSRLGWDDLEVTRTTEDRIEGRSWHAPDDRMIGFSLDVVSGEYEGGALSADAGD